MRVTNKFRPTKISSILLSFFFLTVLTSLAAADENYGNLPPDENLMSMSLLESVDLPLIPMIIIF